MSLPDIYPNSVGDELYSDALPLVDRYGDPEQSLWVYLHGLGLMLKQTDDISRDGPNGEPGWSQIFDLTRAKTEWLPWIGQLVGYRVPQRAAGQSLAAYDARERERIVTRSALRRGTVEILVEVVQEQLNDPKKVIVNERVGGDANHISVFVMNEQIATSQAEVTRAALSQKCAGLIMDITFLTGANYDLLRAASASYNIMIGKFTTYDAVRTDPGK